MNNILTLAQREFGAFFLSPIAYAVNAIFLFSVGLAFGLGNFTAGGEATLRPTFDFWIMMILCFVIPMLTMRLMSEELRSGTVETLLTVPVSETDVIVGKFTGALFFYLILLGTMLIYPVLLSLFTASFDWKLVFCNYLGLLLLGGLYIAVGLFFSTLTRHQVIAVLASFAVLALMTFASSALAQTISGWPKVILQQISVRSHYEDFVKGMLDLNNLIFFMTMIGLFLFLSVKLLETRRWK